MHVCDTRDMHPRLAGSWFVIDLLAVLPFGLVLTAALHATSPPTLPPLARLAYAPRLLRAFKLLRVRRALSTWGHSRSMLTPNMWRLINLFTALLVAVHTVACGVHLVAIVELQIDPHSETWVDEQLGTGRRVRTGLTPCRAAHTPLHIYMHAPHCLPCALLRVLQAGRHDGRPLCSIALLGSDDNDHRRLQHGSPARAPTASVHALSLPRVHCVSVTGRLRRRGHPLHRRASLRMLRHAARRDLVCLHARQRAGTPLTPSPHTPSPYTPSPHTPSPHTPFPRLLTPSPSHARHRARSI